ncbi:MAG TPA: hypothetical protein PKA27_02310 [Fimbriimonadaceae bacterium]|nr:hypothetical protein [Fimbriimonadaceae bacterium]
MSFGICCHTYSNPDIAETINLEYIEEIRDAGAKWIRHNLFWNLIESTENRCDYRKHDQVVQAIQDAELKHLANLYCGNNYVFGTADDKYIQLDSAGLAKLGEFVKTTLGRYAGKIQALQIHNEPNGASFWKPTPSASEYFTLVEFLSPLIREIDPDITIVSAGLSNITGTQNTDTKFLQALLRLGLLDLLDVVALHPYIQSAATGRTPDLATAAAMIRDHRGSQSIWATDWGYTPAWSGYSTSSARQTAISGMLSLCQSLGILPFIFSWTGTDAEPGFAINSLWSGVVIPPV